MKRRLWIAVLLTAVSLCGASCTGSGTDTEIGTDPVTESVTAAETTVETTIETTDETVQETLPETEAMSETEALPETEAPSETADEPACIHQYSDWTELDLTFHEHRCTLCDAQGVAKHNWVAGEPDHGQTPYTCSVCSAEKFEGEYIPDTEPPETTPPKPYDPVYMADAEALVPNFAVDSTQHITSADLVENYVRIVPTIGDPYYMPFAQITGGRYIAIKYRTDNATGMALQFYLASTGTGPVDDSSMMRAPIVEDGEWHVAFFDTQPLIDAGIYDGTYVSYFRFDPMDCEYMLDENGERYKDAAGLWARYELPEGAYIDIEYVSFFETEEQFKMFEHRPSHYVSAEELYENASVSENPVYNQFMYADMEDDYIKLTGTDTDAYVTAILPGTTDAVTTKYLSIKYRTAHKDLLGQVFAGSGEIWTGDQNKTNFPYEGDGEWHLLTVDLTGNTTLTGNAGFLRYDFFQYGADPDTKEEHSIDVQYLAFFESAEEAAAFDAAYDAARSAADGSEEAA